LDPQKLEWLRTEDNIYKLATRYKVTKALEKESLENLFMSVHERNETKAMMKKIKKAERIQPFD